MKQLILFLFCSIFTNNSQCQNFINGDLDGVINGPSCLANGWQIVSFDDPNCLATQSGGDSPDLLSLTQPEVAIGVNGNPFSGSTFMAGAIFLNSGNPLIFSQEGISQSVNGFIIGNEYAIHFRQAVVKMMYMLDKSGSWAVYIDTVLAGLTTSSYSNEVYNSINLTWEARSINFTATDTSHLIKFLPMDNDTNYTYSMPTDTIGGLYMGIDSINLSLATSTKEINQKHDFSLFPNLNNGNFKLQYNGAINKRMILYITDVFGKNIDSKVIVNSTTDYENTSLQNGMYFYSLREGMEELGRGKFLVVN